MRNCHQKEGRWLGELPNRMHVGYSSPHPPPTHPTMCGLYILGKFQESNELDNSAAYSRGVSVQTRRAGRTGRTENQDPALPKTAPQSTPEAARSVPCMVGSGDLTPSQAPRSEEGYDSQSTEEVVCQRAGVHGARGLVLLSVTCDLTTC